MRLLVRDPRRAGRQLGAAFEYVAGSVTDPAAVDRAVPGMDGVHVSLGVEDPAQLEPVEHADTATVAAAAARYELWVLVVFGPVAPVWIPAAHQVD